MNVFEKLELYWKLLKVDIRYGDINSKVGLKESENITSVSLWSDRKCQLVRAKLKHYRHATS